jgi:hypothetical protein
MKCENHSFHLFILPAHLERFSTFSISGGRGEEGTGGSGRKGEGKVCCLGSTRERESFGEGSNRVLYQRFLIGDEIISHVQCVAICMSKYENIRRFNSHSPGY